MKFNGIFDNPLSLRGVPTLFSMLGIGQVVTTVCMVAIAPPSNMPQQVVSPSISSCGKPSPWKFDSTHHSNQTLGDRSFYVHIPSNYNPDVAHPVVLSYHGYESNDVKQEKSSGFSQAGLKINNLGIIAVYPLGAWGPGKDGQSILRAWQGAPYAKPEVDDVAFTEHIISELKANLCVDEKRIYAAGMSNGGGFTNLLACTPSTASLIAAFAPVSAALYAGTKPLDGCNPGRVIPLINFHGLADHIIPYKGRAADKEGDTDYATPSISAYREAWAIRNGCSPTTEPRISHPYQYTTARDWECSSSNPRAVVKGYSIQHLGHKWPTTHLTTFDATPDLIVPFFEAHAFN